MIPCPNSLDSVVFYKKPSLRDHRLRSSFQDAIDTICAGNLNALKLPFLFNI